MDFTKQEEDNGVRMSWNIWPSNRLDALRMTVPIGCMYTPLKQTTNVDIFEYEPVSCRSPECGAILNPYCMVDLRSKTWTCPFCIQRNTFPPTYAQVISETVLPAELQAQFTTIEYVLPPSNVTIQTPVILFCVDTVVYEEELVQLKDNLLRVIQSLPSTTVVGLITFGTMILLHELTSSGMQRSSAFMGSKETTTQQLASQLGLGGRNDPRTGCIGTSASRFLVPAPRCEFQITNIIDDLTKDTWPCTQDNRPARCTGAALGVACSLLEATCPNASARIVLLTGGPPTIGPGMVVAVSQSESIRSHTDLIKEENNARFTKPAIKYYNSLAQRCVNSALCIDIFACNLDQVGLHEMKVLAEKTGGSCVLSDSFSMHAFTQSFQKFLGADENGYLGTCFNGTIDVLTSREVACSGVIGPCYGTSKKTRHCSDLVDGDGGTSQWRMAGLDERTTLAFYFQPTSAQPPPVVSPQSYIQFQTTYNHPSGRRRQRITTLSTRYLPKHSSIQDAGRSFDQEAAASLTARLAVYRCNTEEPLDVMRWLDRSLIKLVTSFSEFTKNEASSFRMVPEFRIYPQLMFHLRRSNFLQTFNASPDETAFYRLLLLRENVVNSLVMIQPSLLEYSFSSPTPMPVLLDASSLKADVILLLDSYTQLVLWRGDTIQAWFDQGYQEKDEYSNLKELLSAPEKDAMIILRERFPVPKFVQTSQGGSQARFLTSRVNPSITHKSHEQSSLGESSMVMTDDVSLEKFINSLIKMVVES